MSSKPSANEKNNSPAKSESSSSSNKEEEIKNFNNESDCESIISEREGTFHNKKKNEMMQKIIRSKLGGKSILDIAKDLNTSIGSLDGKVNIILSKHHRDYIVTFNEFMNTVKKDLREKIDELERIDGEKKKSEDIFKLKAERDFFRKEAIRLNEICIEQEKNFENIKKDLEMKKDDYDSLFDKFRETEFLNKEILLELEENVKTIRKLEKEKKLNEKNKQNERNTKLNINMKVPSFNNLYNSIENEKNFTTTNYNQNQIINSTLYNTYSDNNNNTENNEGYKHSNLINFNTLGTSIISFKGRENSNERKKQFSMNSNYNFDSNNNNTDTQTIEDLDCDNYNMNPNKTFIFDGNKEKIIRFIDRIKVELKKEKMKNNKLIGDLNNIISDRKKLERIFIDCFEESRKEILQRKMKDTINWKGALFNMNRSTNLANLRDSRNSLPKITEVKFENFQTSDKRKLVENFLLCDEVINLLKQYFGDKIVDNNTTSSNFHGKSFAESFKNLKLDYKNNVGDLKMNNDMSFVNELKKNKSTQKLNSFKIPLLKK